MILDLQKILIYKLLLNINNDIITLFYIKSFIIQHFQHFQHFHLILFH